MTSHKTKEPHPAGAQAPVTLSGRPASEADECHAANLCIDAAVLFLTGDRAWPDGAMVLRDQFRAIWREHARGVPGLGDGAERRVEAKAAGLRWCRHCGEGTVAGLCRKGLPAGQCPMDAPAVSGVPVPHTPLPPEMHHEVELAWNDLPDSLKAHPGVKRLYRACGVPVDRSGQPHSGMNALRDVVRCLRETGRFVDDEGEATNALDDLAQSLTDGVQEVPRG